MLPVAHQYIQWTIQIDFIKLVFKGLYLPSLYFRKRYSGSTLPIPDNVTSASSREGGDEYSSEASEMDTQVVFY